MILYKTLMYIMRNQVQIDHNESYISTVKQRVLNKRKSQNKPENTCSTTTRNAYLVSQLSKYPDAEDRAYDNCLISIYT